MPPAPPPPPMLPALLVLVLLVLLVLPPPLVPGDPNANWEKCCAWTTTSQVLELPTEGFADITVTVFVVQLLVDGSYR